MPQRTSALSGDDRDILAGISVMVLVIATRQNLAEQAQQALDLEDATEGMETPDCAELRDGDCCVREPSHSGWHNDRPVNGVMN